MSQIVTDLDRASLQLTDAQLERYHRKIPENMKDDVTALLFKFNASVKTAKIDKKKKWDLLDEPCIKRALAPPPPNVDITNEHRARQKRIQKNKKRAAARKKQKLRRQNQNPLVPDTKENVLRARDRIKATLTSAHRLARCNLPADASAADRRNKQYNLLGRQLTGLFRGRYRKLTEKVLKRYLPSTQ